MRTICRLSIAKARAALAAPLSGADTPAETRCTALTDVYGWMAAGLLTAAPADRPTGWQDIATGPKDVDAYDGLTRRIILGFAPDEENYSPESCEGHWNPSLQRWSSTLDPGWETSPQPTHWMERPAPPHGGQTA
mgnify:FL=1